MVFAAAKRGALSGVTALFTLLNLMLFIVIAALAADLFDSWQAQKGITPLLFSALRPSSIALLMFSLLSASVGMATSIFGFFHAGHWHEASRLTNLAASMITLALSCLSAGFAVKVFRDDSGIDNTWAVKLRTLGAIDCTVFLMMLLYVIFLTLFKHHTHNAAVPERTVVTNHNDGVMHQKQIDTHHNAHDRAAMHA